MELEGLGPAKCQVRRYQQVPRDSNMFKYVQNLLDVQDVPSFTHVSMFFSLAPILLHSSSGAQEGARSRELRSQEYPSILPIQQGANKLQAVPQPLLVIVEYRFDPLCKWAIDKDSPVSNSRSSSWALLLVLLPGLGPLMGARRSGSTPCAKPMPKTQAMSVRTSQLLIGELVGYSSTIAWFDQDFRSFVFVTLSLCLGKKT